MKKFWIFCVFLIVSSISLSAITLGFDNLYDRVVPVRYDRFDISGNVFGSDDAFLVRVPFDGTTATFQLGARAEYLYVDSQEEYSLFLRPRADLSLGTNSLGLLLSVPNASYRLYNIELAGYPGFYFASTSPGESIVLDISPDFSIDLPVFGGVGIGRLHDITNIALAELLLKHFSLPAEGQTVGDTARTLSRRTMILNPMKDNHAENHLSYYQELAQAMGITDPVDELVLLALINANQVYAFESERYAGLRHGWEVAGGLEMHPSFEVDPAEFNILVGPRLRAQFAGFLVENQLHYNAGGSFYLGLDTDPNPQFYIGVGADGNIRYLPDNYRWWIDGAAGLTLGYEGGFSLAFKFEAVGNYLVNPNFTIYAGTGIDLEIWDEFSLFAGGKMRLW